uniref:Reverse transcriptase domain-containing protein n=1 Tax=Nicotiana tabacum TaxID=4097 RepID=A0A1S3Z6N5_TOBAC|nr:PREDICTED: uncharacterized protein LOC107783655 [Nicotiana tabacum]
MDFGYFGNPSPGVMVVHLVRTGSDHAPLLISTNNQWEPKKYFRFLNFWTEQEDFLKVVEQAWNTIGNIFDKIKELQNRLAELENRCLNDNSECNRIEYNNVNAQLIRHIKNEESFWRQKAGLKWYSEGDNNTRFFGSVINSRRKKLKLTRIKKQDGTWIENKDDIVTEAVAFFEQQFAQETTCRDFSMPRRLPRVIGEDDNLTLEAIPTMNEVKQVVFSMSSSSSPGPDGLSGKFFHQCWDIIAKDLYDVILDFSFDSWSLTTGIPLISMELGMDFANPQEVSNKPLSPSLFVIGVELLSNMMDKLKNENFIPFFVDHGSPLITHLTYADDTILFSSGDLLSISMIIRKLENCEQVSGQMVNKRKFSFLVSPFTPISIIEDIKCITGFSHSPFPFTYLGALFTMEDLFFVILEIWWPK